MNAPEQNLVPQGPDDNKHYLRAVVDMADRCKVVTRESIYTDRGIKLVEKGVRVDNQLYDRLVRCPLRKPIDSSLEMEDAVSVASLLQLARTLCAHDTLAYLLDHTLLERDSAEPLLAPLRAMQLTPPLAFKLTVMREQHPALFEHSVRVMLVAVYLGIKTGWSDRECVHLATAALLHDIGVLHMDPVWHDPKNKVMGAGRKQLNEHPITAAQVIHAQDLYPRSVEQAVLEHHECMDGSGYPRGLRGEEISPMGQILLVAEVVAAFFEKYANDAPAQRLSLTLRLNHRKFPSALVACLLPVLQIKTLQAQLDVAFEEVERTIAQLSEAFASWESLRAQLPPECLEGESDRACTFVTKRLEALQKTLYEAGSHPEQQADALFHLQGDAQSMAELALLGREALWQLQAIVDTTQSRWPHLDLQGDAGDAAVAAWRDACAARLKP